MVCAQAAELARLILIVRRARLAVRMVNAAAAVHARATRNVRMVKSVRRMVCAQGAELVRRILIARRARLAVRTVNVEAGVHVRQVRNARLANFVSMVIAFREALARITVSVLREPCASTARVVPA